MRKARILGRPGSCYHVISRFVDRQFALGEDKAKRVFRDIMLRQEKFSGVEILTYCLMGNHFHILVKVPEAPYLSEREVLRRVALIWSEKRLAKFKNKLAWLRENSAEGEALVEAELDRQRKRMYSLSEFVKDIKQRFSVWYNHHHERKGTLFEERYKSVLVEDGRALRMMAAYIDLNPVRAGLVDDPVDYPWCGYAQAVGGDKNQRIGLRTIMTDPRARTLPQFEKAFPWRKISRSYRLWLVDRGRETHHRDGRKKKKGFTRAEAIAAWESKGAVPPTKLLRCKARCFTDSLIFGSRTFIQEEIESRPELGVNPKPHDTGQATKGLCGLVPFRKPTFG